MITYLIMNFICWLYGLTVNNDIISICAFISVIETILEFFLVIAFVCVCFIPNVVIEKEIKEIKRKAK